MQNKCIRMLRKIMCNNKANHPQKKVSSRNLHPEGCQIKSEKSKQFCVSCHNVPGCKLWPFCKDKMLRSLQGSYYETKRLQVSGERVQKKIWTERLIYLHSSRRGIWVPPMEFSCKILPKKGCQLWLPTRHNNRHPSRARTRSYLFLPPSPVGA